MANLFEALRDTSHPGQAGWRIGRVGRNSIHFAKPGAKEIVAVLSSGPISYLAENGYYEPLTPDDFVDDGYGFYGAPGFPFKVNREGVIVHIATGYSQQTLGVYAADYTPQAGISNLSKVADFGQGYRDGQELVRPLGSIAEHRIRINGRAFKEDLILNEAPSLAEDFVGVQTIIHNSNFAVTDEPGDIRPSIHEANLDGLTFPEPTAFDAEGKQIQLFTRVIESDGLQRVYTIARVSDLQAPEIVYPVTLDPSGSYEPTSGGYDGAIIGQDSSWSTCRATAYTVQTGSSYMYMRATLASQYIIARALMGFPTNSIGPGVTIQEVELNVRTAVGTNYFVVGNGWNAYVMGQMNIQGTTSTVWSTYREANYDAILAAVNEGTIYNHTGGAGNWYAKTVNPANCDPEGVTWLAVAMSRDIDNAAPSLANQGYISTYESGSYIPYLEVTYAPLIGGAPIFIG